MSERRAARGCGTCTLAGRRERGRTGRPHLRLRRRLTEARLDPATSRESLRRRAAAAGVAGDSPGTRSGCGFITNAAKKKIPIESIKRVTGQRSSGIVLVRCGRYPLRRSPAAGDHRVGVSPTIFLGASYVNALRFQPALLKQSS